MGLSRSLEFLIKNRGFWLRYVLLSVRSGNGEYSLIENVNINPNTFLI